MPLEDMPFGACKVALARHVIDMSRKVTDCIDEMSARSPICQQPRGGADADMSADADISSK